MPPKKKDKAAQQKENIKNAQTKKRKNAQVSPDNLNIHPLPEKRPDSRASPSGTMDTQQGYIQPMNMSTMGNINNYQTQPETFYSPRPNTSQSTQYIHASPQLQPTVIPPVCNSYSDSFQKSVLDKLMSLDNRLNKLDSIEKQLTSLSTKISNMDVRVTSLEGSVRGVDSRVTEVEASRAFDSQICDDLKSKNAEMDKTLQAERRRVADLKAELESLKSVPEDIDDLRSRSMRCNLLFHGFPEEKSHLARKSENCTNIVYDFLVNSLNIPDAREQIKIERAHRIGSKYDVRKPRPVVVMFNHYPDKILIKQRSQELWKKYNDAMREVSHTKSVHVGMTMTSGTSDDTPSETIHAEPVKPSISVSDQFPKSIQDRRKALLPAMIKAKKAGKSAYLSYDKLYIDNKMYTVNTVSSSGFDSS